ncbi:MAG TPA: hypothetical protein VMF33_00095 [Acidimicrobiales bacterium]|nr:hypothetical protein [Acidimicrobiales bacterium]
MSATYEDAQLVVQLMQWETAVGVDDALAVLFSESFDPETASLDDPNVRKVLTFGETVGALVKHHVLDRDLIRDVYWFDGIWERVKHHALTARAESGEAALYENFESLVSVS